ncbi:uncharacterized protein LOC127240962 [Andrographis paniculata]|uniref:uncharacterized protein LOC127240962 n=1 Tax=Andrographis paniculata TaxID=175694 RepID=UPI0021E86B23|nr:uncharacterized protein LOC127240962 [Andrographis paniculata]
MMPQQRSFIDAVMQHNPPTYSGSVEPGVLEFWVEKMEMIFRVVYVPPDQRANIRAYFLEGRANRWWLGEEDTGVDQVDMTWDEFKTKLKVRFTPSHVRKAKKQELLDLKQGSMPVEDYFVKFNELEMYVPDYFSYGRDRIDHFVDGLQQRIQEALSVLDISSLYEAYELAARFYQKQKVKQKNSEKEMGYQHQFRDKGKARVEDEPKDKKTHAKHLRVTLNTLRARKLYAKVSKYEFWLKKVAFLGHVVSGKGKQNVVADALSRKPRHKLGFMSVADELCQDLARMEIEVLGRGMTRGYLQMMQVESEIYDHIRAAQMEDNKMVELAIKVQYGQTQNFNIASDGSV